MKWNNLNQITTLDQLKEESKTQKVLIFKHSTRCSISSMALAKLERAWKDNEMISVKPYLLDLLANRNISNHIVDVFGITHESPQILLIADGKCIHHNSHNAISYQEIKNNMVI